MDRKWIGKIYIASSLALIIIAILLALYYNVYEESHEGPMDWWAIVLLCVPLLIFIISRIIIDFKGIKVEECYAKSSLINKIGNILNKVFIVISIIILFPILLIFILIDVIVNVFLGINKKIFKKLINKGFKYKNKDRAYILIRKNIIIKILYSLEDYYISFDNGTTFVRVEESNLGLPYNREQLNQRLYEYKTAHHVDRQRGDVVPPISYFVDFLDSVIE